MERQEGQRGTPLDPCQRIKIELIRRNLSQTVLARRIGTSLPNINMIIRGKRKTRWIRDAIARELSMPVERLFSLRPPPSPGSIPCKRPEHISANILQEPGSGE